MIKKTLLALSISLISGCSVFEAPSSWYAEPLVIDKDQNYYKQIIGVSTENNVFTDMEALRSQSNHVKIRIKKLMSLARHNLDRASGGNFGAGLLAAGVGLSGLDADALLGAGYLTGAHVALSTRLSPANYLQQTQKSLKAFQCLDQVTLDYQKSYTDFVAFAPNTVTETALAKTEGSERASLFTEAGLTSDANIKYPLDFIKMKRSYLSAIDASQARLDAEITLDSPNNIRDRLVQSSLNEANSLSKLTEKGLLNKADGKFVMKSEELDGDILICLAMIE